MTSVLEEFHSKADHIQIGFLSREVKRGHAPKIRWGVEGVLRELVAKKHKDMIMAMERLRHALCFEARKGEPYTDEALLALSRDFDLLVVDYIKRRSR